MIAGRTTLYSEFRELKQENIDGSEITASIEISLYKWDSGGSEESNEYILKTTVRAWGAGNGKTEKEILERKPGINEEANFIRRAIEVIDQVAEFIVQSWKNA
jgi:hypothetical protein